MGRIFILLDAIRQSYIHIQSYNTASQVSCSSMTERLVDTLVKGVKSVEIVTGGDVSNMGFRAVSLTRII